MSIYTVAAQCTLTGVSRGENVTRETPVKGNPIYLAAPRPAFRRALVAASTTRDTAAAATAAAAVTRRSTSGGPAGYGVFPIVENIMSSCGVALRGNLSHQYRLLVQQNVLEPDG